jgi:RNA-binding protein PNO1
MEETKQTQIPFEDFEQTNGQDDQIELEDGIPMENLEDFRRDIDFEKVTIETLTKKNEIRRIPVPPHRMTPLRNNWEKIVTTVVENMKLQIRMNTKRKCVELKSSEFTVDRNSIQKGADFLKAFMLGFDLNDAIALLRMDDLFIESFEIKDVKTLHGDHLSRCIGRISGEKGKTKFAIENATKTRIVLAETKVHVLGSFSNIKIARDAICSLILGSPPGKVYSQLKFISRRYAEKF